MATPLPAPNPVDELDAKFRALAEKMLDPVQFRAAVMNLNEIDEPSRLELIAGYDRAQLERHPGEKARAIFTVVERASARLNYFMGKLTATGWTVPADAVAEDKLDFYTRRGETEQNRKYNVRR